MDDKQRGLLQATIMAGIALGVTSATGCFSNPIYCCPISIGRDFDGGSVTPVAPRELEKAVVCNVQLPEGDAGGAFGEAPDLSVSPDGAHVYVHGASETYRFNVNEPCSLTLDKSFGDAGVLQGRTSRVFETERGVFVADPTGLHALGAQTSCSLPPLLGVMDTGDRAFGTFGPAGSDKSVVSVDTTMCPSAGVPSEGTLQNMTHVAAGVGDAVVYFATGGKADEAPLVEAFEPSKRKVTRIFTLNPDNAGTTLAVEDIRGCGRNEICVATGPRRALNRFSSSGTFIARQQLDEQESLPENVRQGLGRSRAALTRTGVAYYAYLADGKLGIMRASVNFRDPSGDAGAGTNDGGGDAGADTNDAGSD